LIEKAMWKMLIDIANGEKTLCALRMFLGLDLHKVEVSDSDKYCLFPDSGMIDEEHPGAEPKITATSPLPLLNHLPYSSLEVAKEVIGVSSQQSSPTEISASDILSFATLCQNWPKTTPQIGSEPFTSIQVNHYAEECTSPKQDWPPKLTEGACF
jgi:hypothetical protein